ncbi:hypothetical protein AB4Y86_11550 [Arthrobacter sp. 2YAF22_2]
MTLRSLGDLRITLVGDARLHKTTIRRIRRRQVQLLAAPELSCARRPGQD